MFGRAEEALAFAEPFVPKRYHTWLRVLPQWKNEKLPNSNRDNWVQYFCPYFTTEGLLRQAWDDARRVGGADGRKLVRIVTAWRVEGQYLVWSAEVETPFGLATTRGESMPRIRSRTGKRPRSDVHFVTLGMGSGLRRKMRRAYPRLRTVVPINLAQCQEMAILRTSL